MARFSLQLSMDMNMQPYERKTQMEISILEEIKELKKLIQNKLADRWLSLREVCDYTNLSPSTLRRAINKGELKSSKKTGKLMFKRSWIDNFLED